MVHAAGISPTMADARRIFDVDLVGTLHMLDGFEALVKPGTAAVCFSSSSAYQIAPFVDAAQDELIDDPGAADFLDRASAAISDSGHACRWPSAASSAWPAGPRCAGGAWAGA